MKFVKSLSLGLTILLCQQLAIAELQLDYQGNNSKTDRITIQGVSFTEVGFGYQKTLEQNPIINGHNLYATEAICEGDTWTIFYGGWLRSGQPSDNIYRATTKTLDVTDGWSSLNRTVVSEGSYLHINDPSVSKSDDGWYSLYTAAKFVGSEFRDWINYSTSPDGVSWTPNYGTANNEVSMADPSNLAGGTITDIARPSIVKTDTGWRMWFDASTNNGAVHSYLAESVGADPTNWQIIHRYDDINGFPGFYEPDVALRPDGTYLAVVQHSFGMLYLATSTDGIEFTLSGSPIFNASDPNLDVLHISNPGLLYDEQTDKLYGVAFGMTESPQLVGHDIGFAYNQYTVELRATNGVWYAQEAALGLDEMMVQTLGVSSFDMMRVRNPHTGEILLETAIDAAPGDVFQLTTVPEPATLSLMGIAMLAVCRRK